MASLYAQPASLAFGAAAGIATAITAALVSRHPLIVSCAAALVLVAVARVMAALWFRQDSESDRADTRMLEIAFQIGALTFALLAGLIGALTLVVGDVDHLPMLTVTYALVYGVGIAARNAGRPAIAMSQLLLASIPILIAAVVVGGAPLYVFAGTLFMLVFGMTSITRNVFEVLREQIAAAKTSATMADQMREQARTDVVTGLLNRAGLNHELVEQLMRLPDGRSRALFWLDLDRFKEVNDTLGHAIGDGVLAEVARRLIDTVPEGATGRRSSRWRVARTLRGRARCRQR